MNPPPPISSARDRAGGNGAGSAASIVLLVAATALLLNHADFWKTPAAWTWVALGVAGCALTVRWWSLDRIPMRTVLVGAVLLRLVVLPFPPLLSSDGYRYLWDGVVMHLGESPYRHVPSSSHFSSLHESLELRRMNSGDYHSVYPPLTQVFFYLAATLRGFGFHVSFVTLKLLFVLVELAGLRAISRHVAARDLMLYAWNPLVVLAIVGQGHTETAMIGFLLLTVAATRSGRPAAASLALAAAGWIKLVPFALFPFLFLRFGWRRIWLGPVAALVVGLVAFDAGTFGNFASSLKLYLSYFEFYAGPYFVLREIGWKISGTDPRPAISLALAGLLAVAWLVILAWQRRHRPRFEAAAAMTFAAYLVCSRTVHPWYLGGILCLLPFVAPRWRWPWLWLAAWSWGTYLLYAGGTYRPFVWIGWSGWFLLIAIPLVTGPATLRRADPLIQRLLRARARDKARRFLPALEDIAKPRILDVGAAEGYLGQELARGLEADVTLVDLHNRFRVPLPGRSYDGRTLPFPDGHFDAAVACYVLHHTENAGETLREMARVAGQRVVILESWARTPLLRRLLAAADIAVNVLRGGSWSERVHYRSIDGWTALAAASGLRRIEARDLGGILHRKLLLVFEPAGPTAVKNHRPPVDPTT